MEKKPEATEPGERGFPFFGSFGSFNGQNMRWAIWPMEMWLNWQADMLKAAAPATADWLARRREGTEVAMRALERLCACHNAQDVSKIQSEWIEDETNRLQSDMRSFSTMFGYLREPNLLNPSATQSKKSPH